MKIDDIEKYAPMVYAIAWKYRGYIPRDDLVQEGYMGVMRAAKTFDPKRGVKFGSYARWWVLAFMSAAVIRECTTVRLPNYVWKRGTRIYGSSFDAPTEGDGGSRYNLTPDDRCPDPVETALKNIEADSVHEMLETIPLREAAILRRRFFDGADFRSIGADYGITGQRAQQIVNRALERLREKNKSFMNRVEAA